MCHLCSDNKEEVQTERERLLDLAKKFTKLGRIYYELSTGTIKPHTIHYFNELEKDNIWEVCKLEFQKES